MLYLFVPTLGEKGPFFNLIGISSVVAIVAGVRLHRPARTLPWYLFAGGMFVFLVGDVFYYTIPRFTHQPVPFPSTGDVFYLSVYPLLIAGVVLLIRYRNQGPDRGGLLDALIISTGVALVAWAACGSHPDGARHAALPGGRGVCARCRRRRLGGPVPPRGGPDGRCHPPQRGCPAP